MIEFILPSELGIKNIQYGGIGNGKRGDIGKEPYGKQGP